MKYLFALAIGHLIALFRPGTIVRVTDAIYVLTPENMERLGLL